MPLLARLIAHLKNRPPRWRRRDSQRATGRGWDIFEVGEEGLQLQYLSDADFFRSDQHAWRSVVHAAGQGDSLSRRALRYLAHHCPEEHHRIMTNTCSPAQAGAA
jgi:hypothetical protein